jgi:hypothetical protein
MSIWRLHEGVKRRNRGETEFIQAVQEAAQDERTCL